MKANALQSAGQSSCQLMPLFPYLHAGAIVPCTAAFETDGSGKGIGYFVHQNTVDEVVFVLAGNGPFRAGDVVVGPKEHGVGKSSPQAFFALTVITQRQLEDGDQPEALTFECEKCGEKLFRSQHSPNEVDASGPVAVLPTTIYSDLAANRFNADPALRHCESCGHDNPPFPLPIWGWDRYVRNMRIATKAGRELTEGGR